MLFRSDRKSTRLNSSHTIISYAVFCLKKKEPAADQQAQSRVRRCGRDSPRTCAARPRGGGEAAQSGAPGRQNAVYALTFFFLSQRAPPKSSTLPPAPALRA